jgi:hypothetical protein
MYKGVAEIFSRYWLAYGGTRALICSPYLHISVVLLAITTHHWLYSNWWQDVTSVIPSLLGFTLGGFAVFIGFGDEKFRQLLAEPDFAEQSESDKPSIYTELCSTFVHFIIIQCAALLYAITFESLQFFSPKLSNIQQLLNAGGLAFSAFGYLLYLYALVSILAVTMHLFRIATMYEQFQKSPPPKP